MLDNVCMSDYGALQQWCTAQRRFLMNLQIENSISRIFDQAISRYQALLTGAREQTGKAAGRVVRGKKPVKTISKLSLKLTAVTHRTADKVLKQQAKMVENQIDAVAGRLRAAAESRNLRELVIEIKNNLLFMRIKKRMLR